MDDFLPTATRQNADVSPCMDMMIRKYKCVTIVALAIISLLQFLMLLTKEIVRDKDLSEGIASLVILLHQSLNLNNSSMSSLPPISKECG